jgi:hypothetical protein
LHAALLTQIEEQPDQILGVGLQNPGDPLLDAALSRALSQPLLEGVGEGRSAVSRGKPLLQGTLCVNRSGSETPPP